MNQLYIYIYPLFFCLDSFPIQAITEYLSRVPCAIQQVLISYPQFGLCVISSLPDKLPLIPENTFMFSTFASQVNHRSLLFSHFASTDTCSIIL